MANPSLHEADYIPVTQGSRHFFLTRLPASILSTIAYAAVRGIDDEEGAVQRVLNTRRIASVRDFTLQGGDFPSAVVLNWTNSDAPMSTTKRVIRLPQIPRSAQIIDGQHRIAGISAAIDVSPEIGELQIPVAIYHGLSTTECADIFLSINTEQKTVPRSLVFDLFGVASESLIDPVAVRARDVAMFLHESSDSPLREAIKLPGSPRRRGGIALSTVVSTLKPLIDDKGAFDLYGLSELETQKKIVLNLFRALAHNLGPTWHSKDNAFMYASGFSAAVRFLQIKLLPYCANTMDFTEKFMQDSMAIDPSNFVLQKDLRGLGGDDSINRVYTALVEAFAHTPPGAGSIKI